MNKVNLDQSLYDVLKNIEHSNIVLYNKEIDRLMLENLSMGGNVEPFISLNNNEILLHCMIEMNHELKAEKRDKILDEIIKQDTQD